MAVEVMSLCHVTGCHVSTKVASTGDSSAQSRAVLPKSLVSMSQSKLPVE